MCDGLVELRDAMARYAAAFNAALLGAAHVERVIALAAATEGIAATLTTLAAARLADGGSWKTSGERSAAHRLAGITRSSVSQAKETVETGRRLLDLPAVAEAARAGQLSPQQASVLADAAAANRGAESRLVALAKRSSLAELREECARVKAAACPDPEGKRRAIHAGRYLRSYTDAEGAWNLRMRDNPEVGARVMAALEPVRDRLFKRLGPRVAGNRSRPMPPTRWWRR
jgi:hypothetical protein